MQAQLAESDAARATKGEELERLQTELTAAKSSLTESSVAAKTSAESLLKLQTENHATKQKSTELSDELAGLRNDLEQLKSQLASEQNSRTELDAALSAANSRLTEQQSALAGLADVRTNLDLARAEIETLKRERAELVAECEQLTLELTEATEKSSTLESAAIESDGQQRLFAIEFKATEAKLRDQLDRQSVELDQLRAEHRIVLQKLERLSNQTTLIDFSGRPALAGSSATRPTTGDDLTQLPGVGPAAQKQLTAAGVTTFAQIAAWTAEQLERDEKLKRFKARAARFDWIEEAKKLLS